MVGNGIEMNMDFLIDCSEQNLRQGYNYVVKYSGTAPNRKMGIFGELKSFIYKRINVGLHLKCNLVLEETLFLGHMVGSTG